MAEPKVEITYKDDEEAHFSFTVYNLDPDSGAIIEWYLMSPGGSQLNDAQTVYVNKGEESWTSPVITGYYEKSNEGEHPPFTYFQHDLVYTVYCSISTGKYNAYVAGSAFIFYPGAGVPYVTEWKYTLVEGTQSDIEITSVFNMVYPYIMEIGVLGTWFELFVEASDSTYSKVKDGWFHDAINDENFLPSWEAVQDVVYDEHTYRVKWRMLVQHGDKVIIRLSNKYRDVDTGATTTLGPNTTVIEVNITSVAKPFLMFYHVDQADYSYDGGRVSGVINGAISIKTEDWNSFIAVLQQYYDSQGRDWSRIYAEKGEGLTAERWNAVISTLKQYYEANGYLLDDRIQEVQKGQRIYPEMIMRVNHAFNI